MTQPSQIVTVIQGECTVSDKESVTLSTVLGSCIAVCMYDKLMKVGGMNHFLLATAHNPNDNDIKYGVNAMELLINKLLRLGADRSRLEAKMFGGARMTAHARDIGGSNIAFAKGFLQKEGIPCVSSSVGGDKARRVRFFPTTGAARQLQIAGMSDTAVVPKRAPEPACDIVLF